jgi:hypothetical protein
MKMRTLSLSVVTALALTSGVQTWGQDSGPAPAAPEPAPVPAAPPQPAANSAQEGLSPAVADVVKMYKAGVNSSVIITYIQHAPVAFHPRPQEVIRLNDLGIPSEITTALLQRDPQAPQPQAAPVVAANAPQYLPPAVSAATPATQAAPPIQEPIIVGTPPAPPSSSVVIIPYPPRVNYFGYEYVYPYYNRFGASGAYYPYGYWEHRNYWGGSRASFGFQGGFGQDHGRGGGFRHR